jgi:hypothetical protein
VRQLQIKALSSTLAAEYAGSERSFVSTAQQNSSSMAAIIFQENSSR